MVKFVELHDIEEGKVTVNIDLISSMKEIEDKKSKYTELYVYGPDINEEGLPSVSEQCVFVVTETITEIKSITI